jgi:hypothetical protein
MAWQAAVYSKKQLLLLSRGPRRFLSALRRHLIVFRRPAARRCIRWQLCIPKTLFELMT